MEDKLYNLPFYVADNVKPRLLRVILTKAFTRIDFGYQTDPIYRRGGWVTIHPETFHRVKGTMEKLVLERPENIPLKPLKHHFQTTVDKLYFSLFFPSLPDRSLVFDLIESEPGTRTDFNYFGITLKREKAIPLMNSV